MKYIGKWKSKEVLHFNQDTFATEWKDAQELLADDSVDESDKQSLQFLFDIGEDGQIRTLIDIPEGMPQEEIDEAIASGECELCGDLLCVEKHPWKEEDGKILWDTGTKGEVLGEAVNPWEELKEENGLLCLRAFRLTRAD